MKYCILVISIMFSVLTQAEWVTINTVNTPTQRHENGFVAINSKLLLVGGRGDKHTEVLDLNSKTWSQLPKPPIEMHHITPVAYQNDVWVITGLTGKYPNETPLDTIYKFDTTLSQWQEIMSIPKNRRRGAAGVTIHNDNIYIVGGIKNGHTSGTTNMVDVFNITHQLWETLPDAPHIRDHNNLVVINNQLVALGGRNTSVHYPKNFTAFFGAVIDTMDLYDIEKRTWSTLPSKLPVPGAGAGSIAINEDIYFLGGENKHKPAIGTVYKYNIKRNIWTQLPPLNTARHGTNLVAHKQRLYIGAGSGRQGGRPELTSVEMLTTDAK